MSETQESVLPLVLNVDDQSAMRYARTRALENAGFRVIEADNGAAALEQAARHAPDVVVLDVRLPDLSGIEVCRRLKSDPATAGIMVLQTSAVLVRSSDRVRGLEGGADHYLAEPFEPEELVATVRALLRIRRAESANRATAADLQQTSQRLLAQNRRLELLTQAAAELLTATDMGGLLDRLFRRVAPELRLDFYVHYVVESDGTLRLDTHSGVAQELAARAERIRLGDYVSGLAATDGELRQLTGIGESDDPRLALLREAGVRTYLCVPMTASDRVVGTLGFGRLVDVAFEDDEVRFLRTLTGYVALARERLLAEAQISRQAEELREADRRKDEFLAILAHELRNPLAPIRNSAQVLKMLYPDDEQLERWRGTIERQARHLASLVDDLLDVSRVSQGRIVLRRERHALATAVASAIESAAPLIESKRHRLEIALPPEPVEIVGDPTRVSQMVANLLTNAAKYTPDGGRIELGVEREGEFALVRVRDNGIGIAPQALPRLFELFSQGDQTLARSQGGLGVGLALTRRLAQLHGGTVEAASDGPGRGSVFVLRLPLASGGARRSAPAAHAETVRCDGLRVLLVEDNVDAAESALRMLQLAGHDAEVAHDADAALRLVPRLRPQVVVLDIGLPGIDGYELARRLRALPETRQALLVAMSGYGQPEDLRNSALAGCDVHLVKPVDPQQLLRTIARADPRADARSSEGG